MNGIKGINPGFHSKKKPSNLSLSCFNPRRIVVPSCEIMIPVRWVAGVGAAEERWDVLPGRRGEDEEMGGGGGVVGRPPQEVS